MENVMIRAMTVFDIDDVLEIEKRSFATPWSRQAFESEIGKNLCARYIVARINGKVAGYAGMWLIIDECHITNVAVHPDYRGMHIGDAMMKYLVNTGMAKGVTTMTLEVRKTNYVAQNLYKKYGFEPVGVRQKYYGDNGEDAIIMLKRF
jgi:ribosomal-protein-alanine acetyltransferase